MSADVILLIVWGCGIPIAFGVYRELVGEFDDACPWMVAWPLVLAFLAVMGAVIGTSWIGRAPFIIARRCRRKPKDLERT